MRITFWGRRKYEKTEADDINGICHISENPEISDRCRSMKWRLNFMANNKC